jgi:hypothetical protein
MNDPQQDTPRRGGRRPGAGRKRTDAGGPKVAVSAFVTQDVAAYLAAQPNRSRAIEDAVRISPGFRSWSELMPPAVQNGDNPGL